MKLHLGCGRRFLRGFKHIDIDPYPHIDIVSPLNEIPLPDSSAEIIYSAHALEYYDAAEARKVLAEWYRLLAPSGLVYVSVPDFDRLVEIYNTNNRSLDKILGPLFGRWSIKNYDLGSSTIYHKTVYNLESLTSLMTKSGFVDVGRFNPTAFLASIDPEFDDYSLAFSPHLDRSGIQVSLCLTGSKPPMI